MPQKAWSAKRERQYTHIKDSLLEQGKTPPLADEIAARVVNKQRAQHGETVQASATAVEVRSTGAPKGPRPKRGTGGLTLQQLRDEARKCWLKGRSAMNKAQLEEALDL